MNAFYEKRREHLLNEDSYQKFLAGVDISVTHCRDLLASEAAQLDLNDLRQFTWRSDIDAAILESLVARYSAGESIESFIPLFKQIVVGMESSMLPQKYRTEPFCVDGIDAYAYAMWLFSLCVLLRQEILLPRLLAIFDVAREINRGTDRLFEALIGKSGLPAVPTEKMLTGRKTHEILLEATQCQPGKRSLYVSQFLKKWYPAMKGTYWHGKHERSPETFFGYWAFEAGLVTYLWDIDDSSYRDLPFYPKDLVDWARQHKDRTANGSSTGIP
jgi:hypothetical protein